ncbi:heme-binding domain-containing protein [Bryobacter aggregatus]|uniref:heme-binding domain-containing protein n=1 Tax=Bryobacter aggregatus TaxID=360054 RepID=UPI00068C0C2E|nr:heme-binding domain-containing protein [Bryobacter aggregatus]
MFGKWILGGIACLSVWAAASTFSAHRMAQRDAHIDNSALLAGTNAPKNIENIVDRACRDCHSNKTTFPWYAGLPPISWMVEKDVEKGRKFLNMSNWEKYSPAQKVGFLASMTTSTMQNRMPPQPYRILHWPANLSASDRAEIKSWAIGESKRIMAEVRAARKAQSQQ